MSKRVIGILVAIVAVVALIAYWGPGTVDPATDAGPGTTTSESKE